MTEKSPFREATDFMVDINQYLLDFGQVLNNQVRRIATYFEINCYNNAVRFYQNQDFEITMINPDSGNGNFVYQLSPAGNPNNFSFFLARKDYQENGKKFTVICSIRQNVRVQSKSDNNIFFTPDIVISHFFEDQTQSEISSDQNLSFYQNQKQKFYFIANENLITFAEAKHYSPFPELIGSFIGIVHVLKPDFLRKNKRKKKGNHFAPSLLISGEGANHVSQIKTSFENRYAINILFELISDGSQLYEREKIKKLNKF